MTAGEYRSIELSIDQALRIFEHTSEPLEEFDLAAQERLKALQAELHALAAKNTAKGKHD